MTPTLSRESRHALRWSASATTRLRRRLGRFIVVILGAFLCLGACAAPSAVKLEAARKIVKELDIRAIHAMVQAECVKEGDKSQATELFETDPAPFGGLSPESAYWPQVEGVFRRQKLRVCQAFTAEQYAEELARQLAGRLPAKKLSSGTDPEALQHAVQDLLLEAVMATAESAEQSMDATSDRYTDMMVDELTAIIECYQREPK